jgi:hypothetical protein
MQNKEYCWWRVSEDSTQCPNLAVKRLMDSGGMCCLGWFCMKHLNLAIKYYAK